MDGRAGDGKSGDGVGAEEVPTSGGSAPEPEGESVPTGVYDSTDALLLNDLPVVPGYRICRELGTGGMGTVYEAEQLRPRRVVALKILKPERRSSAAVRRFETEIQVLATIEHPNIARIYEAGTHRDGSHIVYYYSMELIPGALPIDDYAARHNLSVRQRVELFLKVCDAVYAGHCRGVIHRDLKPANILVAENGEPRVIDFGVSRYLSPEGEAGPVADPVQTQLGQLVGTLRYMSPEQIEGRPDTIDVRSDVYTLGVILYELLTGELPYEVENRSLPEMARTIRDVPPRPPSGVRRALSGDLETILLKALEKPRDRRYQTAEALRKDLTRCLAGEPIEARRPTVPYVMMQRARQLVNRSPILSMLLVAAVVGLLVNFVAVPVLYVWVPVHRAYMTGLAGLLPPSNRIQEFRYVRVIGIDEEALDSLEDLAQLHGVSGVRTRALRSARALGGVLMKRLAEADAAVVSWDLSFIGETPGCEGFVEGVKSLQETGVPVLVVHPMWGVPDDGVLKISPVIAPHVGYAHAMMATPKPGWERFSRDGWAHVMLMVERGRPEAVYGYALATAAAYRHPEWTLAVRLNRLQTEAILEYWMYAPGPTTHRNRLWRKERDYLPVTYTYAAQSQPAANIYEGDQTVVYAIEMPADAVLHEATYRYSWALTAPIEELRSAFAGKVVMIGDVAGGDRHDLGQGRIVDGVHIQAAAVESILRREMIKIEPLAFAHPMLALGCLIGVLGGMWMNGFPRRAVLVLVAGFAGFLLLSFWLYSAHRFVFDPLVPGLGLGLTALAVFALQRVRRTSVI